MLPMALNTNSQSALHKQKDIPYLPRRLLLWGVCYTETENNILEKLLKCVILTLILHFLLKKCVFVGVSPIPVFTRRLFEI